MSAADHPPDQVPSGDDAGRVDDPRDYGTLPTVVPESATFVYDGY